MWKTSDIYTCIAEITKIGDPRIVTNVTGKYFSASNNEDVVGVIIDKHVLKNFPCKIENFFPKLEVYDVKNSQVEEVNRDDLFEFLNLKQISFWGNKLHAVERSLF